MDESKHEIHSQVDAITAGTASMVNLTAGGDNFISRALVSQIVVRQLLCCELEDETFPDSLSLLRKTACVLTSILLEPAWFCREKGRK